MQHCPICQTESNDREKTCLRCGYPFPLNTRRSRLPRGSLVNYPRYTDPVTGKVMTFHD